MQKINNKFKSKNRSLLTTTVPEILSLLLKEKKKISEIYLDIAPLEQDRFSMRNIYEPNIVFFCMPGSEKEVNKNKACLDPKMNN